MLSVLSVSLGCMFQRKCPVACLLSDFQGDGSKNTTLMCSCGLLHYINCVIRGNSDILSPYENAAVEVELLVCVWVCKTCVDSLWIMRWVGAVGVSSNCAQSYPTSQRCLQMQQNRIELCGRKMGCISSSLGKGLLFLFTLT